MIEFPLVLMAGLLGSSHCLGMCGGFVLSIGAGSRDVGDNLRRQAAYTFGRIFTYAALGAAAGFFGLWLTASLGPLTRLPAILALLAGGLLVYQGLSAAGVLRKRGVAGGGPCVTAPLFRSLLTAPGLTPPLLAGLFTGLLPCGLLYGMLALAASGGDTWNGLALMAVFAAGTAPALVLVGCGGGLLGVAGRRRLIRAAAWCVVATGAVTLARGVAFLGQAADSAATACPLCG